MLKTLFLKFGRTQGAPPEKLDLTPVTVFVGPNNSGKSLILREIYQFCSSGTTNRNWNIVDRAEFLEFSTDGAKHEIESIRLQPQLGEAFQVDHIIVGKRGNRIQVREENLLNILSSPNNHPQAFAAHYLSYNTLMLDGSTRINLVNDQPAGDLQQPGHTSFQVLFRDDAKRDALRRAVEEAFGSYLVVDPTNLGRLRLRLSRVAPSDPRQERGIDSEAVTFHQAATPIEHGSDGVKAFVGIMTEIIAGDPKVILIDEPEAFLHPALAFKLGKEIASSTLGSDKRLFVSTHSPQFVMGCVQSGAPINIVRLTYRDSAATARVLPSTDLVRLMRNPLLRSTGLLSGLFYEFVVVTESDADRAFYQEVNERLLARDPNRGIPNCLFLNAQNKQTIQQLIRPLRDLGIPAAAIVDIDVIEEGGSTWVGLLNSAHVPSPMHQPLSTLRATVKDLLSKTGKNMKKDGGVNLLHGEEQESAINLFQQLAAYGVFVVQGGELESWLKHLGVPGHGPSWLIKIFEKMGENPSSPEYVVPSDGDVWSFISDIRKWLTNPDRKGIAM